MMRRMLSWRKSSSKNLEEEDGVADSKAQVKEKKKKRGFKKLLSWKKSSSKKLLDEKDSENDDMASAPSSQPSTNMGSESSRQHFSNERHKFGNSNYTADANKSNEEHHQLASSGPKHRAVENEKVDQLDDTICDDSKEHDSEGDDESIPSHGGEDYDQDGSDSSSYSSHKPPDMVDEDEKKDEVISESSEPSSQTVVSETHQQHVNDIAPTEDSERQDHQPTTVSPFSSRMLANKSDLSSESEENEDDMSSDDVDTDYLYGERYSDCDDNSDRYYEEVDEDMDEEVNEHVNEDVNEDVDEDNNSDAFFEDYFIHDSGDLLKEEHGDGSGFHDDIHENDDLSDTDEEMGDSNHVEHKYNEDENTSKRSSPQLDGDSPEITATYLLSTDDSNEDQTSSAMSLDVATTDENQIIDSELESTTASVTAAFLNTLNSEVDAALSSWSELHVEKKVQQEQEQEQDQEQDQEQEQEEVQEEQELVVEDDDTSLVKEDGDDFLSEEKDEISESVIKSHASNELELREKESPNSDEDSDDSALKVDTDSEGDRRMGSTDALDDSDCSPLKLTYDHDSTEFVVDFTLQIDEIITKLTHEENTASEELANNDNVDISEVVQDEAEVVEDVRAVVEDCILRTIESVSMNDKDLSGMEENTDDVIDTELASHTPTTSDDTKEFDQSPSPHITPLDSHDENIDEMNLEIEQYFQMGQSSAENKRVVSHEKTTQQKGTDGLKNIEDAKFEESDDCISLYFSLGKLYAETSASALYI